MGAGSPTTPPPSGMIWLKIREGLIRVDISGFLRP